MNGLELYAFLNEHLVEGQVLYISGTGGFHKYRHFLPNGNLQFSIPNNANPGHPNTKSIPQDVIIQARDLYQEELGQFEQLLQELHWQDCRNAVLRRLVQLPDYLEGNIFGLAAE